MKRFLFLTILFFSIPSLAHGATEFISIVDTGGASDSDYSTLSTWETGLGTNLTAPSTLVFSGVVTGTAPIDNSSVTLYRSGASTGVGATVVHTAKTGTQILLENVSDPAYGFTTGDEWRIDASNLFTIDATTPGQPQVTAKCRATTGLADATYVTISGWDTDSTHYIKIWTDPSENYRHQGKWDTGKYRLEVSTNNNIINNGEEYFRVDGLQVLMSQGTYSSLTAIRSAPNGTGETIISNNIVAAELSGSVSSEFAITLAANSNYVSKVYNNIIYGFQNGATSNYSLYISQGSGYLYNNTIVNSYRGIYQGSAGAVVVKNNLVYNNTDNYSGSFDASSANNLSGPASDAQLPGTAPQNGVTVTFADEANNDFHLDSSDTGAKNNGIILYDSGDDANLNFTTDIDNEARKDSAGTWDIGADENVAKIYRSVGVGATAALASGGTSDSTYGNMEIKPSYLNSSTAYIADHIATFWRPLPDNVGVGDAIQYDANNTGGIDNVVFITKRIDSTHYSVRKADGTAPTATSSLPNNTWGIYRSYISLSNAEAGTENTGITDAVENFDTGDVDLTTNNLQWNFTMFANGTASDSTAVTISNWTTAADNYMRIYTPTRTDEVGTTQRHAGKWDTTKYYISITDADALSIYINHIRVDGLQITVVSPSADGRSIIANNNQNAANELRISNNLLKGHASGTYYQSGIQSMDADTVARVWNNIIYDIPTFTSANNRGVSFTGTTAYFYNNTFYGGYLGLRQVAGNMIAKNNIVQNTSGSGYFLSGGTWDSASTYNLSNDATAPGLNPQNSKTVLFADLASSDYHLGVGDTAARNVGTDLSNDLYLPINSDIDSNDCSGSRSDLSDAQGPTLTGVCNARPRATSFDIGADELITEIYRSVGVGTTAAIISGTSTVISLTISGNTGTFATWPTSADFGVGDVIRYDSDNNGTVDSTAFISAIDSTAKTAILQNSTGGTAPQMAVGDFDWKLYRAYVKLSEWESGTENTGVGVTYDSGNRDIATNSEQWNVACYSPSGTAPDTTAVSISGWTTAQQNYIKIYTPTLSSEVTTSQRHQGKWDEGKYRLEITNNSAIGTNADYITFDGLQIKITVNSVVWSRGIYLNPTNSGAVQNISNNIIQAIASGSPNEVRGIMANYFDTGTRTFKIWNNITYGFTGGASSGFTGIYSASCSNVLSIYNNTAVNSYYGIYTASSNTVYAKNNISSGNSIDYSLSGTVTSSNNISSDATSPNSTLRNKTVNFVDANNYDFHLAESDTSARNAGADLSQDLYLPIISDIDSHQRLNLRNSEGSTLGGVASDIGADEGATAIYRSLAPGATSSIASGTSPANSMIIAGTSVTFGTAPGDTIGVGDAIQYDSDNNGIVDSVAFISSRVSSTSYIAQDRTGGTPTSTSATDYDWSIFRAYTSLANATGSTGGTENTGIADAVEHFDIDWAANHGKNLYTANQQWNVAAYANSMTADTVATSIRYWTTYPTNYIKVYTPYATTEVGTSQRHQGKWDDSKYHLQVSTSSNDALIIRVDNARIDGLQIYGTGSGGSNQLYMRYATGVLNYYISNNIVKVDSTNSNVPYGIILISTGAIGSKAYIWNNIVYDYKGNSAQIAFLITNGSNNSSYLYNNTMFNSAKGVSESGDTILKNNIAQNCTDGYSGTFDSSSDYNISDVDASDAPNATFTNDYVNVTFADEANDDFHLASNDTAARNSGADLSADTYLPVTTDIDGHARPTGTNVVDIGADEGATAIYYSVGQSTATDFKVASNVTVSGYTATFDTAQTGNIGVGDIVTYDGGSCNITGKTSTSVWSCQNVTGGTAPQVSGVSVSSIKRAFASLNASIGGSTAPTFLNTSDLKTNNYQLNLPCYMDSGTTPDTTAVTIQGYTTAVPNYIKVYTPNNTTTEANNSQRHQGKWDDGKFHMTGTIIINSGIVRIDGLQLFGSGSLGNGIIGMYNTDVNSEVRISNNIIKNNNTAGAIAIHLVPGSSGFVGKIWNNIIYDFETTNSQTRVVYNNSSYATSYVHNNTVIGGYGSFYRSGGTMNVKNNITQGSAVGFNGTMGGASDYNISDIAGDTTGISTSYRNGEATIVTFADSTNYDFHLGIGDTAAQNYGADLSADSNFAFSTDIDGNTRNLNSRGWDIGADEAATAIYYSVGQSSSDLKTGSPTLSISIDASGNGTLSSAQTGNMGVGDYIEYGTSPYNKAYISGKTSTTVWTVQSATGSLLGVGTTEPVNSIKHAYTTLNGAIAGASGATMMNTTDLYTNNLQLSVPCYMDSGTADTTAVGISGYTTYSTNYIKVYTPTSTTTEANNSQRHSGKWDDGKYRLETTNSNAINNSVGNVRIEGLQIKITAVDNNSNRGIVLNSADGGENHVSSNIIKGVLSGTSNINMGIAVSNASTGSRILKASNNIIYDFINGTYSSNQGIFLAATAGTWTAYLSNNTIYNCYYGINRSGITVAAKNNISYNNTDNYYSTFDGTSTNNLSGPTQTDAPGSNPQNGKTVNFVDSANYDFHLAESDSSARNAGADLTSDVYLPLTSDVDGNSRPSLGTFDIGADEGATYIYYSVGQNTSDHKTLGVGGSSPTITLSGYAATLNVGQTAPNMGVGDLITYTGGSCYITAKTNDDKMHWNCQNATGGTAPQVTTQSVTSIAHAFSSLNGAVYAGGANGAHDSSHLNTIDLYSGNYILNIPCYYDTGPDTTAAVVKYWTNYFANYIRIYTPSSISTEVNQTQRHSGNWDDAKYNLSGSHQTNLSLAVPYVRIDGLQMSNSLTGDNTARDIAIDMTNAESASDIQISNNILIKSAHTTGNNREVGIESNTDTSIIRGVVKLWNNIIYGFSNSESSASSGVMIGETDYAWYLYNNTFYDNNRGIFRQVSATVIAKNNIAQDCTDGYYGTFASGSDYNISNVAADTTGGEHDKADTTVTFVDSANDDFHLSANDTAAMNEGVDLSADTYLPFSTDIDGQTRGGWCIGADEFIDIMNRTKGTVRTKGNVRFK